jgi:polyisoprenoid-binding protein YceI
MRLLAPAVLALALTPAMAQMPPMAKPGAVDPARVAAGTYKVDPAHTQILFQVDHLGFNSYYGIFGGATGSLTIDPKRPAAAQVEISVPMSGITTTHPKLDAHLKAADFFDAAKFPTATFKSTRITPTGNSAKIAGNLTMHGVTRPVVLDARFTGAGVMPMPGSKPTIGFEATTTVKRSDFGVSFGTALLSDMVPLKITVAFEKQ